MQNYEQSQLPRADSLADERLADESPAQTVPCSETNPTASAQLVTGCTGITVGYLSTTRSEHVMNKPAIQETNPAATGVMTFAKKDVRIHR